MKKQAGHVMWARIQSVELTVQHVGEPGDRMPVAFFRGSGGPDDIAKCQPGFDMQVFENIFRIIEVDKIMISYLAIHAQGGDDKKQRDPYFISYTQPFVFPVRLAFMHLKVTPGVLRPLNFS